MLPCPFASAGCPFVGTTEELERHNGPSGECEYAVLAQYISTASERLQQVSASVTENRSALLDLQTRIEKLGLDRPRLAVPAVSAVASSKSTSAVPTVRPVSPRTPRRGVTGRPAGGASADTGRSVPPASVTASASDVDAAGGVSTDAAPGGGAGASPAAAGGSTTPRTPRTPRAVTPRRMQRTGPTDAGRPPLSARRATSPSKSTPVVPPQSTPRGGGTTAAVGTPRSGPAMTPRGTAGSVTSRTAARASPISMGSSATARAGGNAPASPLSAPSFAPTAWKKPAHAGALPVQTLQLARVIGTEWGHGVPSVLDAGGGELVSYAAALVVVHDTQTHQQRFFTGHDAAVTCIAIHPMQRVVASGQGGRAPKICLFHMGNMELIRVIRKDLEHSVVGVAFSGDGRYLVSVCSDPHCTVAVWDWSGGEQLTIMRGSSERIHGMLANPFDPNLSFVTFGPRHLRFWQYDSATRSLSHRRPIFGDAAARDDGTVCACFTTDNLPVTGTSSGALLVWRGNELHRVLPAHEGLVYALCSVGDGLVSGGADGVVKLWGSDLSLLAEFVVGAPPTPVRSLHASDTGELVIGTESGDVFRMHVASAASPSIVLRGHSDSITCVAPHPTQPLFASCGLDRNVRVYEANGQLRAAAEMSSAAVSLCFMPDGVNLVVGLESGASALLDSTTMEVRAVLSTTAFPELDAAPITAVAVTKAGDVLAAGREDGYVLLYEMTPHEAAETPVMSPYAVMKAHASPVAAMDWTVAGAFLQTCSRTHELCYWTRQGVAVVNQASLRDEEWDTWTSLAGWPVSALAVRESVRFVAVARGSVPHLAPSPGLDSPESAALPVSSAGSLDGSGTDGASSPRKLTPVLAALEATGAVRLLRYPCVVPGAHARRLTGHTGAACVRFLAGGRTVVVAGGHDRTLTVWNVVRASPGEPSWSPEPSVKTKSELKGAQLYTMAIEHRAYVEDLERHLQQLEQEPAIPEISEYARRHFPAGRFATSHGDASSPPKRNYGELLYEEGIRVRRAQLALHEERKRLLEEQRQHDPELTLKPKINESIVLHRHGDVFERLTRAIKKPVEEPPKASPRGSSSPRKPSRPAGTAPTAPASPRKHSAAAVAPPPESQPTIDRKLHGAVVRSYTVGADADEPEAPAEEKPKVFRSIAADARRLDSSAELVARLGSVPGMGPRPAAGTDPAPDPVSPAATGAPSTAAAPAAGAAASVPQGSSPAAAAALTPSPARAPSLRVTVAQATDADLARPTGGGGGAPAVPVKPVPVQEMNELYRPRNVDSLLASMRLGAVVYKFAFKDGSAQNRKLALTETNHLVWGRPDRKVSELRNGVALSDIRFVTYGPYSRTFMRARQALKAKFQGSWLCLSLVASDRTYDFQFRSEAEAETWLLGLQWLLRRSMTDCGRLCLSRAALLFRRLRMKLSELAGPPEHWGRRLARTLLEAARAAGSLVKVSIDRQATNPTLCQLHPVTLGRVGVASYDVVKLRVVRHGKSAPDLVADTVMVVIGSADIQPDCVVLPPAAATLLSITDGADVQILPCPRAPSASRVVLVRDDQGPAVAAPVAERAVSAFFLDSFRPVHLDGRLLLPLPDSDADLRVRVAALDPSPLAVVVNATEITIKL